VDRSPTPDDAKKHADDDLKQRLCAVEDQLDRLRDLLIRTYENTPRATAELLEARRSADYEDAYLSEPLVTVRIGTYNGDELLFERALGSVRLQSYTNWEAIVVCDGRQTSTADRVASLGDSRIRCVQRPRNGPYPTHAPARWLVAGAHPFNEGFALAQGSWIAPIDQDDEWTDDHLEVLLTAAQSTRAEVAYGVARVLVPPDEDTYFGTWPPEVGDFGFQASIQHAGLTTFLYDANAHIVGEAADWNLARRMLEAGVRFEFVDRIVASYHIDDGAAGIEWWRARVRERGSFSPACSRAGT
jgi:glycosyltransferase involved in cell wall biosynthesis